MTCPPVAPTVWYSDPAGRSKSAPASGCKEKCLEADIIIAALGSPGFVTADMVKPGATIIDVGTTRVPDPSRKSGFRLSGDVDFENVAPKCAFITPEEHTARS